MHPGLRLDTHYDRCGKMKRDAIKQDIYETALIYVANTNCGETVSMLS